MTIASDPTTSLLCMFTNSLIQFFPSEDSMRDNSNDEWDARSRAPLARNDDGLAAPRGALHGQGPGQPTERAPGTWRQPVSGRIGSISRP